MPPRALHKLTQITYVGSEPYILTCEAFQEPVFKLFAIHHGELRTWHLQQGSSPPAFATVSNPITRLEYSR
jgi:hypothetical protein